MDPIWSPSQDETEHVIILDEPLPDRYTMQLFENLSGLPGEHNPQMYNNDSSHQIRSNACPRQTSRTNLQKTLHPVHTSLLLPPGYPNINENFVDNSQSIHPHDLNPLNTYWPSTSISSSSTSSISFDMPGLTSSSSTSESTRNYAVPSHMFLQPSKAQSRKFPSSKSSSSFSDTPIKHRKLRANAGKKDSGTAQAKRALAQFEAASAKFSKDFREHSQLLVAQLNLLIEKEIADRDLEADFDEMSITTSNTPYSLVASDLMDPLYQLEAFLNASSSVSSTPRPHTFEARDVVPLGVSPETRVRYYCTYPTCRVQQKECKYKHRNCPCPATFQRYWCESKVDIKRHEEGLEHWPQQTFICFKCFVVEDDNGNATCRYCHMSTLGDPEKVKAHYMECDRARANTKMFSRKDHLLGHLRRRHGLEDMGESAKGWSLRLGNSWPRQCGFNYCPVTFDSPDEKEAWDQRAAHIAWHFEHGSRIEDWRFLPVEPKDRKPFGPFFSNHRRDENDDDDNDGFGGNGGNPHGKLSGSGTFTNTTQQTQHSQSSSSQQYEPYSQQAYYQRSHGSLPLLASITQTAGGEVRAATAQRTSRVSLAMVGYLEDPGDRVPALGTAPRIGGNMALPGPRELRFHLPNDSQDKSISEYKNGKGVPIARRAVFLRSLPRSHQVHLVRQYIDRHWDKLDEKLFCDSALPTEVRDSVFDVVVHSVVSLRSICQLKSSFFKFWWQNEDVRRSPNETSFTEAIQKNIMPMPISTIHTLASLIWNQTHEAVWALAGTSHQRPTVIFLVGGFESRRYLRDKLRNALSMQKITQPANILALSRSQLQDKIDDNSYQAQTEPLSSLYFATTDNVFESKVAKRVASEQHSRKRSRKEHDKPITSTSKAAIWQYGMKSAHIDKKEATCSSSDRIFSKDEQSIGDLEWVMPSNGEGPCSAMVNTFLPLGPELGSNEMPHRRSATYHSDMSYQMRRFLVDQEKNQPQQRLPTPPHHRFLPQDLYIQSSRNSFKNEKRYKPRYQSSESYISEDQHFAGFGLDPVAYAGNWIDGEGLEIGFSSTLSGLTDELSDE